MQNARDAIWFRATWPKSPRERILIDVRQVAFLLFALTAAAASSQETMQLGAEIPVAAIDRGGVLTDVPAVVPSGSGFTAYINVNGTERALPVASDGTSDFSASSDAGPPAQVAVSQSGVLLFGTENGSIFAAHAGAPRSVIIPSATLQRVACVSSGCAITFFPTGVTRPSIVTTDADGQPNSDATPLPDYSAAAQNVAFVAPDAAGVTLFRGGTPVSLPHIVRIDRSSHVVFDIAVLAVGIEARLIPMADQTALVAPQLVNGAWSISAMTIDPVTGALSTPRRLANATGASAFFTIDPSGGGYLLAVPNGSDVQLFAVDAALTTSAPAGSFRIPSNRTLTATASNGNSVIAILAAERSSTSTYYAMSTSEGALPSLLSEGLLTQQPRGVVAVGDRFLVAWSEVDTDANREILRARFISADGVESSAFELGRSLATNLLPLTAIGTDVLALWYDDDIHQSRGVIVHADSTLTPVNPAVSFPVRVVAPMTDRWVIVGSNGLTTVGAATMTASATTSATQTITSTAIVFAAASDGQQVLLIALGEAILLSSDLKIEARHSAAIASTGSVAFGPSGYLFADGSGAVRIDRQGAVGTGIQLAAPFPTVIARPTGWLVVSATSITPVSADDPPVAGTPVPLSGIDRGPIATSGNRAGLLYARGPQVFFRTVGFVAPRRRVVAP